MKSKLLATSVFVILALFILSISPLNARQSQSYETIGDPTSDHVSRGECAHRVLQETPVFDLRCGCYQPRFYCTCGPGFC